MSYPCKTKHASPSGAILPEKSPHPVRERKPFRYEPQSVIAARAVVNEELSIPPNLFMPQAIRASLTWSGEKELVQGIVRDGDRAPLPFLNCPESKPKRPWLVEDKNVIAGAIDESLREVFSLIEELQNGHRFKIQNHNVYIRFSAALFDEMETLLEEWDELEGLN